MTKLEMAFAQAAQLPPFEQEALAEWILEELASERRWDDALARLPDALANLTDSAVREHEAGETQPLDPDRL